MRRVYLEEWNPRPVACETLEEGRGEKLFYLRKPQPLLEVAGYQWKLNSGNVETFEIG